MLLEEKDQIGWSSVVVCGRISIGEKCDSLTKRSTQVKQGDY